MNTINNGIQFEKIIYDKFSYLLNSGMLAVKEESAVIKYKPKYFSKDRNSYITFDVSIEVTFPGNEKPSILIIIECKNYTHTVPVDDIEEFNAKINQIGSGKCKGIICTTNGFQKSTYSYAVSNGIGLCRLSENDDIAWDLARLSKDYKNEELIPKSVEEILTNPGKKIASGFFSGFYGIKYCYSILEYLSYLIDIPISKGEIHKFDPQIKYISKEKIKNIINNIFKRYNVEVIQNYQQCFENIVDKIVNRYKLVDDCDLGLNKNGNRIIGRMKNKVLYTYDNKDYNNPRWNFTIAHEIGHLFLHSESDWYEKFTSIYSDIDLLDKQDYGMNDKIKKIEIQANIFAAEFLLPDSILIKLMQEIIKQEKLVDKGYGYLYLDNQPVNINSFYKVASIIRDYIKVSNAVIEIKLYELGFLKTSRVNKRKLIYEAMEEIIDNVNRK